MIFNIVDRRLKPCRTSFMLKGRPQSGMPMVGSRIILTILVQLGKLRVADAKGRHILMGVCHSIHSRSWMSYGINSMYIYPDDSIYTSPGATTQPRLGILFPYSLNNSSPSEASQIDIDSNDILCCPTHEPSTTSSF